ncbi:hypothetical protein HDU78_006572 [Chytriomyces hyalinus]|nr:hypothetical protein HDU78_006572 [Chytriomyces hyalinus]KAJ3265606.1 hypothetical protein HDU77_004614 [Chytriomyces hyalinus]KAJ3381411.1 hypothetical protein HDU80_001846 [Chytriomyces hyalinus]
MHFLPVTRPKPPITSDLTETRAQRRHYRDPAGLALENKEIARDDPDPRTRVDDLTIYNSDYSFRFDLHPTFQHPRFIRPKLAAPETGPVETALFDKKEELQKALNRNLYVSLYQASYLSDTEVLANDPQALAKREFEARQRKD